SIRAIISHSNPPTMQATATATGSAIWPSLVFIMGEERRSFVLQSPAFSVGRKADKDLTLLNPRVSRDHAMIVREGDGYFVQDQDSKHGTYVNGERVNRHKLQPNDRIERSEERRVGKEERRQQGTEQWK